MPHKLITTLVSQHRELVKNVTSIAALLKEDSINYDLISTGLKTFETKLLEHLKLEDETLYPTLLKGMKEKGHDTKKTEMFIEEMVAIEKVVIAFLDKYRDSENIKTETDIFTNEFNSLIDTLALRIESEEAGVYSYWGLF